MCCGHWGSFGLAWHPVPRVRLALRFGPVRCRPPPVSYYSSYGYGIDTVSMSHQGKSLSSSTSHKTRCPSSRVAAVTKSLLPAMPGSTWREWTASRLRRITTRMPSPPYLLEHQKPSDDFLLHVCVALSILVVTIALFYRSHVNPKQLLRSLGVSLSKVARAAREVERKGFHLAGLLVPLIQLLLLRNGFTPSDCTRICWTITIIGCSFDFARLHVGFIQRNWPLRSILREHEHTHLTGGCYFSLGCTLSIGAPATICTTHPQPSQEVLAALRAHGLTPPITPRSNNCCPNAEAPSPMSFCSSLAAVDRDGIHLHACAGRHDGGALLPTACEPSWRAAAIAHIARPGIVKVHSCVRRPSWA